MKSPRDFRASDFRASECIALGPKQKPIPGKPGIGAQFVSFNFLNPLICAVASSPDAFSAVTPASRRAHSLKVVFAIGAIVAAGPHAAGLKISVRSRTGTDRCDRASR
jgi:hypothetical protein